MTERDLDEVLRRLDPARHAEIPAHDDLDGRRIRRAAIRAGRPGRMGRRSLVAVVVAIVVLSAGVAAGVFWSTDTPEVPSSVLCLDQPNLDGVRVETGVIGDAPAPTDCRSLWEDGGVFGTGAPAPELVGCVIDGGALAVFPGDDQVCRALGLSVAVATESLTPLRQLQQGLADVIAEGGRCLPFVEGQTQVQEVFEEAAVPGWSLRVGGDPDAEQPCLSYALDTQTQQVVLIPIPEAP